MSFPSSSDKYKPIIPSDPEPPDQVYSEKTKAEMAEGKKNAEMNAAKFAAVSEERAKEQAARDEADAEAKAAADEAKRLKMG